MCLLINEKIFSLELVLENLLNEIFVMVYEKIQRRNKIVGFFCILPQGSLINFVEVNERFFQGN